MSLKNLQEISSVVTNYTKKTLFKATENGSKTAQLMEGLISGMWQDDTDAEIDLYGKPLTGRSFDMLKSRVQEQLINSMFILDTKRRFKSSYDKAYFECCKNMLAGLILLNRNAPVAGQKLLKQSLQTSIKYDFTDFAVSALRLLRYSSTYTGEKSSYEKYNNAINEKLETLNAEIKCEELNQILIFKYVMSSAPKGIVAPEAGKFYKICQNLVSKHNTYTTRINTYRVGIRYYNSINDHQSVIKLATECEDYLHSKPHLIQKIRLGEMNLHKLDSALHLRDYIRGKQYAEICSTLFNSGTTNWLFFLEEYFLLCLHTSNYQEALNVYIQVTNHKNFNQYPTSSIEKWKIFQAFLVYALPEIKGQSKKFNLAKFVNEVPIFSKDKAGYNFSIIIAQVILLIKSGDFEKVVDRSEALKLYAARYIKKEISPRSYYFLKMLLVMIKYDFDPVKTAQIASKFYDKLKATHLGQQNALETLEVIPYDILWPKLLDQLKTQKAGSR